MIDDGITHAEGCHAWGKQHYECALREIEQLRELLSDARSGYIPGCGEDMNWTARKDALLAPNEDREQHGYS